MLHQLCVKRLCDTVSLVKVSTGILITMFKSAEKNSNLINQKEIHGFTCLKIDCKIIMECFIRAFPYEYKQVTQNALVKRGRRYNSVWL